MVAEAGKQAACSLSNRGGLNQFVTCQAYMVRAGRLKLFTIADQILI